MLGGGAGAMEQLLHLILRVRGLQVRVELLRDEGHVSDGLVLDHMSGSWPDSLRGAGLCFRKYSVHLGLHQVQR